MMFSRFIHVLACVSASFLLMDRILFNGLSMMDICIVSAFQLFDLLSECLQFCLQSLRGAEKAECDAAVSGHDEEGAAPADAAGDFRAAPRGIPGGAACLNCFVSGFQKGDHGGIWKILDSGSVWYDWPDDTCDSGGCPLYCSMQMQEGSRIRHH